MRYLVFIIALFAALQTNAQNNIVYGAGINYTNGAPTFTPPVRTSRVAIDTVTGRWYHFNTPGGWQLIGNTIEEIAGCTAPAYTPGKGDSKVVVNNCTPHPELYFYNGSNWLLVGPDSLVAGEGIRIENDTIILDSLNFLDFRTGSALDGDVGRVQWNDTDGTLDLNLKGGNVTLQIGQEEVTLVKHADNAGLIEGRVVYIVGSDGANKTVRYALADSDLTSATTFGLMTESATGGNKAFCTTFGLVRNLNTTNLTEGGIVWLSADTAGFMTAVRPTAPDHGVMIGFCVRKHATQGAIFVQVQNGYELNELHDVFAPTPLNGQVLTYNSANLRWEAITPANQLQTLSTDGTPGNISISSGNTITLNVNDADASATNELQALSVAANTATLSNSGGSVTIAGAGINTVGTAGTTITVTGTEVDGSTTNELQTLSAGTNTLTLSNGGGTVTVDTDPSDDVIGIGSIDRIAVWSGSKSLTNVSTFTWLGDVAGNGSGLRVGSIQFNGYGSGTGSTGQGFASPGANRTLYMNSGTNNNANDFSGIVLNSGVIGARTVSTSFSGTRFTSDIQGAGTLTSFTMLESLPIVRFGIANYYGYDYNPTFTTPPTNHYAAIFRSGRVGVGTSAPAANLEVRGSGTSSSTWTAQFHNSGGANNALMIRDDGNVGVGTNAMTGRLNIQGNGSFGIYATSTDPHYFAGAVGIGAIVDNTSAYNLRVTKTFSTVATARGIISDASIGTGPTTVTYFGASGNAAATANVTNLFYYNANQSNFTAGSTFQTQIGYNVGQEMTGATNNYGFMGRIPAGANNFNLYMSGTAKNYLAGNTAIGTTSQNASAAFEVASTTQGVLFPRMTTAQRDLIATPADGLVIYNTTDNKLQVRAAGAWVDLH